MCLNGSMEEADGRGAAGEARGRLASGGWRGQEGGAAPEG
jgi:hypothetical protein